MLKLADPFIIACRPSPPYGPQQTPLATLPTSTCTHRAFMSRDVHCLNQLPFPLTSQCKLMCATMHSLIDQIAPIPQLSTVKQGHFEIKSEL